MKKHSIGCLEGLDEKREGPIKGKHELFLVWRSYHGEWGRSGMLN